MAYYEWYDKETNAKVTLGDVDAYIANITGEPVDSETFTRGYQSIIGWLFAGAVNANTWDNARVLRWLKRYDKKEDGAVGADVLELLTRTLDRYKWVAWRK